MKEITNEDNKTIEDLYKEKREQMKRLAIIPAWFSAALLLLLMLPVSMVLVALGLIFGKFNLILWGFGVVVAKFAIGVGGFHAFFELSGAYVEFKHYRRSLKGVQKEINKRKIIDKIKDINQKKETNGINIDSKKQQEIDKLLNKLKKMLEQEEYQSTVDDIFNERVQLKDDEYTITEEKTANIGSGSIAYAYPKDNIVKKKVLVRK